ncbi:AAC(3) family N-acetyltransferase [Rossellomorea vietnamensis]|uniref:aminoglycoside N(3)-acetyltransferase n=1 Tax=Rossellomorea vietnamensis TaxID=218284 RepID=UPI001E3A528D|nr:AAC(3) family N-acetyltransferase [Rossellomorea vietnamensis]MCC5801889.1 AAC(3) family N-acetyltransferase [Rossellomorea vietnamensis]
MKQAIERVDFPNTKDSIMNDLRTMGVEKGMTIIVHSSLSRIGWVNGGEVAVIQALMEVVTEEGTIVMPTQSAVLSDPSEWEMPPVLKEWWQTIRDTMPAFHPSYTPTYGMGKIPEAFRNFPGAIRSNHPEVSFAAWGKDKETIIQGHSLEFGLGENSPLASLYKRNSFVLLLGVGYDSNTSFHLAEYRIPYREIVSKGNPILMDGERVWKTYQEIETREELFDEIGREFENENEIPTNKIGLAESRLFSFRQGVDYAEKWLKAHDDKGAPTFRE